MSRGGLIAEDRDDHAWDLIETMGLLLCVYCLGKDPRLVQVNEGGGAGRAGAPVCEIPPGAEESSGHDPEGWKASKSP